MLEVTEKILVFDRASLHKTMKSVPMKVYIHTQKVLIKKTANTW